MPSIHRIIEQHAASRGDLIAILDGDRACSYRELNHAANALARHLAVRGFRRGGYVEVRMRRGVDLGIVLLAILKGGGSYTLSDREHADDGAPVGVSFRVDARATEERYLHLDLMAALATHVGCSPNLPIVTRGTDVACVLQDGDGSPAVLVPHATITALRSRAVTHPMPWAGEPGAFDLWMALMAGTTAVVESQAAAVAAA